VSHFHGLFVHSHQKYQKSLHRFFRHNDNDKPQPQLQQKVATTDNNDERKQTRSAAKRSKATTTTTTQRRTTNEEQPPKSEVLLIKVRCCVDPLKRVNFVQYYEEI